MGGHGGHGRGQQLVDQGTPGTHLALEFPFPLPARTDDLFETHGLASEFLTHRPAEKALLMIDAGIVKLMKNGSQTPSP